jgi:hypothetical protein
VVDLLAAKVRIFPLTPLAEGTFFSAEFILAFFCKSEQNVKIRVI